MSLTAYEKTKRWRKAHPEHHRKSQHESMRKRRKSMSWAQRRVARVGRQQLSIEFLEQLQQQTPTCKCCGCVLDYNAQPIQKGKRAFTGATVDKVIPEAGYIPNNVAIICFGCNRLKDRMTLKEIQMIERYVKQFFD